MSILNFNEDDSIFLNQQTYLSVLKLLPIATLIIDLNGQIKFINDKAFQFFRFSSESDFLHVSLSLIIDLQRSIEIKSDVDSAAELIEKKILIRRFDSKIACVNLFARFLSSQKDYILIQFTELPTKNQSHLIELLKSLHREIISLKPYLNKPGKELLDKIIIGSSMEGMNIEMKKNNDADLIQRDRLNQIVTLIPDLSNLELTLCGFLSLKLSFDEIGVLTGKTSNALRVCFHRIVKKSTFANSRDFIRELHALN